MVWRVWAAYNLMILYHPSAAGKMDHLFTFLNNFYIQDGILNTLPFCRLSSLLKIWPFKLIMVSTSMPAGPGWPVLGR